MSDEATGRLSASITAGPSSSTTAGPSSSTTAEPSSSTTAEPPGSTKAPRRQYFGPRLPEDPATPFLLRRKPIPGPSYELIHGPDPAKSIAQRIVEEMDNFPDKNDDGELHREAMKRFRRVHAQGFDRRNPDGTWSPEVLGLMIKNRGPSRSPNESSSSAQSSELMILPGSTVDEKRTNLDRNTKEASRASQARSGQTARLERPVHHDPAVAPIFSYTGSHVMDVEPRAVDVLGVPLYTVELVAWTVEDGCTYWWSPLCPSSSPTHPAKYGNIVSYALRYKDDPFELVKEIADRHPCLNSNETHDMIRFCGTVSYHHLSNLDPRIPVSAPRMQYVYEIQLPADKELFALKDMPFENLKRYTFEEA